MTLALAVYCGMAWLICAGILSMTGRPELPLWEVAITVALFPLLLPYFLFRAFLDLAGFTQ